MLEVEQEEEEEKEEDEGVGEEKLAGSSFARRRRGLRLERPDALDLSLKDASLVSLKHDEVDLESSEYSFESFLEFEEDIVSSFFAIRHLVGRVRRVGCCSSSSSLPNGVRIQPLAASEKGSSSSCSVVLFDVNTD